MINSTTETSHVESSTFMPDDELSGKTIEQQTDPRLLYSIIKPKRNYAVDPIELLVPKFKVIIILFGYCLNKQCKARYILVL